MSISYLSIYISIVILGLGWKYQSMRGAPTREGRSDVKKVNRLRCGHFVCPSQSKLINSDVWLQFLKRRLKCEVVRSCPSSGPLVG